MALIKISGPVGNFREETSVKSTKTYNTGYTQVRTEKEVAFRVDNRPVTMKNVKGMELANGDEATVVGSDTRSGVKAILIRNDTTNMIYGYSTWYVMMWAIILTVIGAATVGVIIGLFLLPMGLYMFFKGYQHVQAYRMMAT